MNLESTSVALLPGIRRGLPQAPAKSTSWYHWDFALHLLVTAAFSMTVGGISRF